MSDLTQRIEAEKRQLLSMRQNQQALASGDLTEADIEAMAIERVRTGRTSGRRAQPPATTNHESRMEYLGTYLRDEGNPLLEGDWYISAYQEPEPGVDDDPSTLPQRQYPVYVMRRGRQRYVCIALDWEPA